MAMKKISMPWATMPCYRNVGNKQFIPRTPWIPASDALRVRATFEIAACHADARLHFAYQTANSPTSGDTAQTVGTAQGADGVYVGTITDISSNTGSKTLVRFGFYTYNNAADTTLVTAAAAGTVEYDDKN